MCVECNRSGVTNKLLVELLDILENDMTSQRSVKSHVPFCTVVGTLFSCKEEQGMRFKFSTGTPYTFVSTALS